MITREDIKAVNENLDETVRRLDPNGRADMDNAAIREHYFDGWEQYPTPEPQENALTETAMEMAIGTIMEMKAAGEPVGLTEIVALVELGLLVGARAHKRSLTRLPDPAPSCIECPECGQEVDTRAARAL